MCGLASAEPRHSHLDVRPFAKQPKQPWRTLGWLCGAVACASLADLCTGRFGARASSTTVVLASSTCSQDDQLLVIERPGGTDMNCDLLSGIRADVDVLDARLAEIRSAHVSGASGPDAQE